MNEFIRKYQGAVTGILSGFDRLVFRGTLRSVSHEKGVVGLLLSLGVRFVDFGSFVERQTKTLVTASLAAAVELGRPVRYLASSRWSKEEIARRIACEDGVSQGLVCVLKCVEPCFSFELFCNRDLRARLYPDAPANDSPGRGRVTRQLRMLRAHGLIRKVPRTHRCVLTDQGRRLTSALLQTQSLPIDKLMKAAA